MKKEEVLNKNHKDLYEEELNISLPSYRLAGAVVVFLSGIFSFWSVLNGESFYGYSTIFLAYIATTNLYQYKKSHEKMPLYVGALALISSILGTVLFFIRGSSV
ncbi:DUF6442 family protein [Dethiobacter alkaliphilus]|uniref:DUF6442 family protein n=1 Tax=Dethiobacter alkaliphilus TaxID=427926 RepID=UPI00222680F1|nr:DUF6442 family protein [Dethiobacter alkaliphilus]MCW3491629.1 DUF6442 family protein [Dethiobacter alkaliphilus]